MRRGLVAMLTVLLVGVVGMAGPAAVANGVHDRGAQQARAEGWGARVRGAADADPVAEPAVAEIPPGEADRDAGAAVRVDRDPVTAAALRGEAEVHRRPRHRARLDDDGVHAAVVEPPHLWNAHGYAAAERLAVQLVSTQPQLTSAGEPRLSVGAVEAEALAACDFGDPHFATTARTQQLEVGGDELPVLGEALDTATELVVPGEPNADVLAATPGGEQLAELGVEITAWETNWDGADGTTDGGDTVWVNALRVSVTGGSPLAEAVGAQDVIVGHSQASVDCAPPLHPLVITADVSTDTVAPGEWFTYTIAVANDNPACVAENVGVTETLEGPAGSRVIATSPPADDVDRHSARSDDPDRHSIRWNELGPVAPEDAVTVTTQVAVPDDAADGAAYELFAAVGGECDGLSVDSRTLQRGPRVAAGDDGEASDGDAVEAAGAGDAGDTRQGETGAPLPATGGGTGGLGATLIAGGALAARLRHRSAS